MTISELIKRLEELKEQHGDVEVEYETTSIYEPTFEIDQIYYLKERNIVVIW